MIQGTMSGVGKSILTAGILRVLAQDGYSVAPFKSQNMALNSFVTADQKEIGRAQALQAYASFRDPSSDMNPILLKPMGDTTSQVIVNGKAVANMRAAEYFSKKTEYIPVILAAYERLKKDADVIVIEGAGSPVEINLRENDIVNMGLANLVDAPVLLAGNIDPGGVFAQLLGTLHLMREEERKRVKGLVINRFRGDKNLLMPGLAMFKEYSDIPFAGVVPYLDLDLDEEDSVSERLGSGIVRAGAGDSSHDGSGAGPADLQIAVVRLPYISNYTDFSVFESIPKIRTIYTDKSEEIANADLVILPGTKNTIADLKWLCESGLDQVILAAAKGGTPVIGICGGFQMLGLMIEDPTHQEAGGSVKGLSLLPVTTVLASDKTLRQVSEKIPPLSGLFMPLSDLSVQGYEIHMGESSPADGSAIAPFVANENVLGTYLHGFFDSAEVTKAIIRILYKRKCLSMPELSITSAAARREAELNRLADALREHLDWELIRRTIFG